MHITFVEIDPKTKRAFCSLQVTQFFSTQEVQASVCKLQIGTFTDTCTVFENHPRQSHMLEIRENG